GGTGFFGKWLTEALLHADRERNLGLTVGVMTRDARRFEETFAHLLPNPRLQVFVGDLSEPGVAEPPPFDTLVHMATEASASLNQERPLAMLRTIITGTETVLEWARRWKTERMLMTSSGAVYGKQPPGVSHVSEAEFFGPDPLDPKSAYAE